MKSEKDQNDFNTTKAPFQPIEYGGKRWLKITVAIALLVLLTSIGVVYWFFYRSKHQAGAKASTTSTHFVEEENPAEFTEEDIESSGFSDEEDVVVEPQAAPEQPVVVVPRQGSLSRVNTPQGLYYTVIGSFVSDLMAEDYAKKLVKEGHQVTLITSSKRDFVYVALDPQPTFQEASQSKSHLQDAYGEQIWIWKY